MIFTMLTFFGITPDKYPFLALGILIVFMFLCTVRILNVQNEQTRESFSKINESLSKVKLNIVAIAAFLSADRPKSNPAIIVSMSPLAIQSKGYEILKQSESEVILEDSAI